MKLAVIGSSGTWPTTDAPTSGFVVEGGGARVMLDAGFGTAVRIPDVGSIDAVVVSHRHPDHCADVLVLHHLLAFGPVRRTGLPLLGPPSALQALISFAGSPDAFDPVFVLDPVDPGDRRAFGGLVLDFVAMDHSVPCNGVRASDGRRSVFYTGDTGFAGSWWDGVEADVLLCEASWQGDGDGGTYTQHLTATQAGAIAAAMGVDRLILTHLRPDLDPVRSLDEARAGFDGPVSHAVPGTTIEV